MLAVALFVLSFGMMTVVEAQAPGAPPPAPERLPDYQIGPDDILKVIVYGHEDLTQTVLVQSDGTFTFPLIGRLTAADKTIAELETALVTALAHGFIRNPQVTVVVQEFRSKTVFVVGELARPGTYPLAGPTRLVEVLAKAGPMTSAAGPEVIVVRPLSPARVTRPVLPSELQAGAGADTPQAETFRISLADIQSGNVEKNIMLHPNDTIFVPQAPKVFVTGEVRNPGVYAWFSGMTARQLISVAGGLTPDGSDGRLKVVRPAEGTGRERKVQEGKIDLDQPIQPGETLVVRRRMF
jgi:polysaccharide biosynthesis/export protein